MAIKWWLGLDTSPGSPPSALCPEHPLDPLGHQALTCQQGGDAVSRQNKLRDVVLQTCHCACMPRQKLAVLFLLVLNKLVSEITTNTMCADLSYHAWYLNVGLLAGPRSAVLQALSIIKKTMVL